jgi:hypothetical protein
MLESLECGDEAPEYVSILNFMIDGQMSLPGNDLAADPQGRSNAVQDEVAGDLQLLVHCSPPCCRSTYFKQDDSERQQLLARVELVLGNADILEEVVREGVAAGVH